MIRVTVETLTHEDDPDPQELARMYVRNMTGTEVDADYSVQLGVERGKAVGLHQRMLYGFPRLELNVWGLLHWILRDISEQNPEILELEDGTSPRDLERRQRGAMRAIQAWASSLRNH